MLIKSRRKEGSFSKTYFKVQLYFTFLGIFLYDIFGLFGSCKHLDFLLLVYF